MNESAPIVKPSKKEIAISLAVVSYIFYAVVWLSPESEFKKRILEPIRLVWNFWGLHQNWALFSPRIREINYHPTATVTFEDGSKTIWEPPRMDQLNCFDKWRLEKYRKWGIDSLPWTPYKAYWPDFARYVGRQYYNANNKPVSLVLNLHWVEIPRPGEGPPQQDRLPPHTKFNTVYCHVFSKEDFE